MLTIPAAIDAHAHAIAGLGVYGFVLKFGLVRAQPAAMGTVAGMMANKDLVLENF